MSAICLYTVVSKLKILDVILDESNIKYIDNALFHNICVII